MVRRKPWCERAESGQAKETIQDKHVWKRTPRMFWGGILESLGFSCALVVIVVVVLMSFRMWVRDRNDPLAPGIWEVALPVGTIGVGICSVIFVAGLWLSLRGKRRMKQQLLPVRCQRCPKCFYDLSNRPRGEDLCPECGIVAPRRECVRLWCKLLRTRF